MEQRVFISFQNEDRAEANGFNLLHWEKKVDIEFVGRHLLDPVNDKNETYIRSKITEKLKGTSVTVVLIGDKTYDSKWVQWEIEQSLEKGNAIIAIRLNDNAPLPDESPVGHALRNAGAETVSWNTHAIIYAIERAWVFSRSAMLTRTPDVCGGRLCIDGTRITVHQITTLYKRGLTAEDIADQYPHLTLAQVYAALAYYHANREEVEAELAAELAEAERLEQIHAKKRHAS